MSVNISMRLYFVIKNLSTCAGGAERVLTQIASSLAERSYDVFVATFDPCNSSTFYPLSSKVKIINLPSSNNIQQLNILTFLRRVFLLRASIQACKPDIAIGFMHSSFVLVALASAFLRIPIIGSEHIVMNHYYTRPFQFALYLLSSFFVDRYTCISQAVASKFPRIIRNKMSVIPNPVSIRPSDQYISSPKKVILNVGRLEKQKDQSTLIKAFSMVLKVHPEWLLHIAGSGSLESSLKSLVSSLRIESNVNFLGNVKDIASEYCKASIFVNSARYESFGLVTAEAMSFSIPCIGFADCPGTNELINHLYSGYLIQPNRDRVKALSSAIMNFIDHPKSAVLLGRNGRDSISSKYSLAEVVNKWEDLIHSLVTKK